MDVGRIWRDFELSTRPIHPDTRAALDKRWADLPPHARTDNQLLGRCAVGCEGTHGVFPKCNLTCSPCYHSADANKVRIDGDHTVDQSRPEDAVSASVGGGQDSAAVTRESRSSGSRSAPANAAVRGSSRCRSVPMQTATRPRSRT